VTLGFKFKMVSNVSIASVVYLIFNQCKQSDSELANADKIIEYIKNNFDYDVCYIWNFSKTFMYYFVF